jgi:hypothetical protein
VGRVFDLFHNSGVQVLEFMFSKEMGKSSFIYLFIYLKNKAGLVFRNPANGSYERGVGV